MVLGHPKIQYFESKIREREICIYFLCQEVMMETLTVKFQSGTAVQCCAKVWHMHSHYQVCLVTNLTYMVWTVDGLHLGLQQTEN